MADDDRRVEPRPVLVGRGFGVTPEKIAELERRAAESQKAVRTPPTEAFAAILAKGRKTSDEEQLSDKEKRTQALPRKGPAPKLAHPSQRDTFGRDGDSDEAIVLKG